MPGVKRFRRFILNAATVLSLLMCAGVVGLSVRSYWRTDRLSWFRESPPKVFAAGAVTRVVTERGRLAFVQNLNVECGWFMPMTPGFTSSPAPVSLSNSGARGLIDWPARCWWPPIGEVARAEVYRFAGFERGHYTVVEPYNSYPLREDVWALPLAFVAALFALLPAFRLREYVLHRRRWRSGLCFNCGYNLCATPDRCPECGSVPVAAGR
jgi:hypothetical protein